MECSGRDCSRPLHCIIQVRFIFCIEREHDDRKGHHYYTTPSARLSCIVVMTLAVIMLCKNMNYTTPSARLSCIVVMTLAVIMLCKNMNRIHTSIPPVL